MKRLLLPFLLAALIPFYSARILLCRPRFFYYQAEDNDLHLYSSHRTLADVKVEIEGHASPIFHEHIRLSGREATTLRLPHHLPPAEHYTIRLKDESEAWEETFQVRGSPDLAKVLLETDRELYRPGDKVAFRLLPLSSSARIASLPLSLSLHNPKGLIIEEKRLSPAEDSFSQGHFILPDRLSQGRWRLRVQANLSSVFQTSFRVEVHSLPHFMLRLISEDPAQAWDSGEAELRLLARYSFGEALQGTATLHCGIPATSSAGAHSLPQILPHPVQIRGGEWKGRLEVGECLEMGFISALVRDYGSSQSRWTTLRLSPPRPSFALRPLQPAFHAQRLSLLHVWIAPESRQSQSQSQSHQTHTVRLTAKCIGESQVGVSHDESVSLGDVATLDLSGLSCRALLLNATDGLSPPILSLIPQLPQAVSLIGHNSPPRPLYIPGQRLRLEVNPLAAGYVLLCDGRLIETAAVKSPAPLTHGIISIAVATEWRRCQILVYGEAEEETPIPVDFLSFDVVQSCSSAVSLSAVGGVERRPGEEVDLRMNGGPIFSSGLVGLTAVDERLSYLTEALAQEDSDKEDEEREEAAFNQRDTEEEWAWVLSTKGSWSLEGFFQRQATASEIERRCMEAGGLWWSLNASCPEFERSRSALASLCQRSFSSRCRTNPAPPNVQGACESGIRQCSGRLKAGAEGEAAPPLLLSPSISSRRFPAPPSIRSFFPRTWLFQSHRLNSFGIGGVREKLPDSVTNWTISGAFWKERRRDLCHSAPLSLTAFKSVFLTLHAPKRIYRNEELLLKVSVFYFGDLERAEEHIPLSLCHHSSAGICADEGFRGRRPLNSMNLVLVPRVAGSTSKLLSFRFLETGLQNLSVSVHSGLSGDPCAELSKLDEVEIQTEVVDKEDLQEIRRSYAMSPSKPKTKQTLAVYEDTYTLYRELQEDLGPETMSAEIQIKLGSSNQVRDFRVEVTPLGPAPFTLHPNIATPLPNSRKKRSKEMSPQPFLNSYLTRLAFLLKNPEERSYQQNIEIDEVLNEILTFGRFWKEGNESEAIYSQIRYPRASSENSTWLSILTATLQCRAEVSPSVVCPTLRHLIRSFNAGRGSFRGGGGWSGIKLASERDEAILLKSFFFLALFDCDSYMSSCLPHSWRPWREAGERLYWSFHTHLPSKTDPVALAATAVAVGRANSPLENVFRDHLYKRAKGRRGRQPHWSYHSARSRRAKGNFLGSIWKRLTSWIPSSRQRVQVANEVLLNSLALLAFHNASETRFPFEKEDLADWLGSQVKADLDSPLATFFLGEALERWRGESPGQASSQPRLWATITCEGCDGHRRSLHDNGYILTLPAGTRKLRIVGEGRGKLKLTLSLMVAEAEARRKRWSEEVASSSKWPLKISATTTRHAHSPNIINQKICLETEMGILSDVLAVEHGLYTGTEPESGYPMKGRSRDDIQLRNIEVTSHAVAFLLHGLSTTSEHCYRMRLRKYTRSRGALASVPIRVRHPSQGLVAQIFLPFPRVRAAQSSSSESGGGGREVRDVLEDRGTETFCWSGEDCVCAEQACERTCGQCRSEANLRSAARRLCRPGNFGLVVRARSVQSRGDFLHMRARIRYTTLSEEETMSLGLEGGSEAEIWQRRDCGQLCAAPLKDELYFLGGELGRVKRDLNSSLPLYFLSDGDHFAPFAHCSSDFRDMISFRLSSTLETRRAFCAGYL